MSVKTYAEIIETVKASDPKKDWIHPFYNLHSSLVVRFHKDDINLRFEIDDREDAYYHLKKYQSEWANAHIDPDAFSYYVRLYYASTLIESFILVSVDGAQASLPQPKSSKDRTVDPLKYKVAQIHDETNTLDKYMELSGLSVSEEH